tara:strand:+ start:25118 stop:25528 length:411 start_codon:yes stop_codon:yes gene_type:complete
MLGNLIKLFVGANLASTGASYMLGPENMLTKSMGKLTGSFLGMGSSSSSTNRSDLKYVSKVEPQEIKLSGASSVGTAKPSLSSATQPSQFPMGYKSKLNISPEVRRLLQDVNDGMVGNQNIRLSLYQTPENKIDVG